MISSTTENANTQTSHHALQKIGASLQAIRKAAEAVEKLALEELQKNITFKAIITGPEGDMGRVAELSRARTILNWTATVSFTDGMRRMFRWIAKDVAHRTF